MQTMLPTTNPDWGFFGTVRHHADPDQSWALAMRAIDEATGCSEPAVRAFLDSRHGRCFADDVASGLAAGATLEAAIANAITRWETWRVDRRMCRETGIPHGLPLLTGQVIHFEILSEIEDPGPPTGS